jgi:hypothetical protein
MNINKRRTVRKEMGSNLQRPTDCEKIREKSNDSPANDSYNQMSCEKMSAVIDKRPSARKNRMRISTKDDW